MSTPRPNVYPAASMTAVVLLVLAGGAAASVGVLTYWWAPMLVVGCSTIPLLVVGLVIDSARGHRVRRAAPAVRATAEDVRS